jgi:hypothetical protein
VARAKIAQAIQIVRQHVTIATRQAIVAYDSLHPRDDIVELPFIIAAGGQLALQLIQLLEGSRNSILVVPKRERCGPNMFQIFADALEKLLAPTLAAEAFLPVAMVAVLVANKVLVVTGTEIAQAAQVVGQQVAIAPRHPIVLHHSLQRPDHIVELPFIVAAGGELALKFVELLPRSPKSELIAATGECRRLHVVQVLPHSLEKLSAPVLASEPGFPIAIISVLLGPVLFIAPVPISAAVGVRPEEVEGIAFGTALRILNPHYGAPAISRVLNQLLPAAAIDACKAEITGIRRHRSAAFESAPLRLLPGEVADIGSVAANLDFGRAVHYYFNCAFAAIRIAVASKGRPS